MITGEYSNGGVIRITTAVHGKRLYLVEWKALDSEEWSTSYMGPNFSVAFKMYSRMTKAAMGDKISFNKKT